MAALRWVAWCEDISALSSFRDALPGEPGLQGVDGITYVTISRTRQRELAQLLSMGAEEIRVIPPPLDIATWLDLGNETRQIVERLDLLTGEPVVFVPAKLLPHKNLELTVQVAACLQQSTPRPLVLLSGAASPHEQGASAALAQRLACLARELEASATFHLLPEIIGATPQRRTIRDLMLLSDLVFLPSAEEGFGIPIEEAAALRTPVLCSDIPSFREVGGTGAWYFPLGAPPGEIVDRMVDIAASPANLARRKAALSATRFRSQVEELVKAGTVAV
jgi:glycosyltransferase involved in cell wall biosynthesis